MIALFKKLNYKNQPQIIVLDAPDSLKPILLEMVEFTEIVTQLNGLKSLSFALVFVTSKQMINDRIKEINPLLHHDATLWFAYPKASSKKYTVDFNRDNGWEKLTAFDLLGVRQVAIDADWSALRFRKKEFIKVIKRESKNF